MSEANAHGKIRAHVIARLRRAMEEEEDYSELLWEAIIHCQGIRYETSGRGRTRSGVVFTYHVKRGQDGAYVGEIIVDRKENSKTITRSTVELAFKNAVAEQERAGCVRGPKRLGTFGASYLYPIFLSWGIIERRTTE